jgi:hypothetical protein
MFSSPRSKNETSFATDTPPGSPTIQPGSEGLPNRPKRRIPTRRSQPQHGGQHNTLGLATEYEWHEPDLTRAFFDQHFTTPEDEWADFDTAMRALAFDGLLAGTTWS